MKLIIGWLVLMLILPLLYLFWWKKSWRLVLGVFIVAILGLSFFIPGEVVYSSINWKIKKEQKNLIQQKEQIKKQLNDLRNKDFSSSSSSGNPEKIALEKEIAELGKEIKKAYDPWLKWLEKKEGPEPDNPINNLEVQKKVSLEKEKSQEWIKKWGGTKSPPLLFFNGKELTQGLERLDKTYNKEVTIVIEGYWLKTKENSLSIIDFSNSNHNQAETVKKEITNLIKKVKQELKTYERFTRKTYVPLIWFKNIDKVESGSELESLLISLFTSQANNDLWKDAEEKKINFSNFIFVTSAKSQNLPSALQTKLSPFEPFLDKHRLVIFLVTGIGEIILLLLLIRLSRKSKSIVK